MTASEKGKEKNIIMDNRHIDLSLTGRKDFDLAMSLATERKVTGYRIDGKRMILYWADSSMATKLPYEMTKDEAANFVWGWLEKNPPERPAPDHDGDNGKGFHIYNESWSHVDGEWQAFIAIEPIWAMYGK